MTGIAWAIIAWAGLLCLGCLILTAVEVLEAWSRRRRRRPIAGTAREARAASPFPGRRHGPRPP